MSKRLGGIIGCKCKTSSWHTFKRVVLDLNPIDVLNPLSERTKYCLERGKKTCQMVKLCIRFYTRIQKKRRGTPTNNFKLRKIIWVAFCYSVLRTTLTYKRGGFCSHGRPQDPRFSQGRFNLWARKVKPVSREQILWREKIQGNSSLPCSADHRFGSMFTEPNFVFRTL